MEMNIQVAVFRIVRPCSVEGGCHPFGELYFLNLYGEFVKLKAARTFETLVSDRNTTR